MYSAGKVLAQRFVIVQPLPLVGRGELYRCHDRELRRELMLKVLPLPAKLGPGMFRAFAVFARQAKKLEAPELIRVLYGLRAGGELLLALEPATGITLSTRLQQSGSLPLEEAVELGRGLLNALDKLHEADIFHGVLTPDCLLLHKNGIKLFDYGLEEILGGAQNGAEDHEPAGRRIDWRADIFGFGLVLYQALTGYSPFKAVAGPPVPAGPKVRYVPIRERMPDLSLAVEGLLTRICAPQSGGSIPTLREVRRAYDELFPKADKAVFLVSKGRDEQIQLQGSGQESILKLASRNVRPDWEPGMALRFQDRIYRLDDVSRPVDPTFRVEYSFRPWPPDEIVRKVVSYKEDGLLAEFHGPGAALQLRPETAKDLDELPRGRKVTTQVGSDKLILMEDRVFVETSTEMPDWKATRYRRTAVVIQGVPYEVDKVSKLSGARYRYRLLPWSGGELDIPRKTIHYDIHYVTRRDKLQRELTFRTGAGSRLRFLGVLLGFLPSRWKARLQEQYGLNPESMTRLSIYMEGFLALSAAVLSIIEAFGGALGSAMGGGASSGNGFFMLLLISILFAVDAGMRYGSVFDERGCPGFLEWVTFWRRQP